MTTTASADIAHPATYTNGVPHDEFERRRRTAPVTWVDEPRLLRHSAAGRTAQQGTGYWAVTTHAAIIEASRRPRDFSSGAKGAFLIDPRTRSDLQTARQLLISMDDPQHARIRRVAASVFTPRAITRLAGDVQAHARAVVDRATARGTFDGVTDLAAEVPLLVLADLLGIPRADRGLLYRWSNNLVGFDDPEYGGGDIDTYRATFTEAFTYALGVAAERRENPRDDLISLLANAEVDGTRLRDREFCQFWLLLVVAGNETTRHLIANSLHLFAHDERLRAEVPTLPLETAVPELLRVITPIMQFRRTATRDVTLAGQPIGAGDKVVLYYVSGNRDEGVFGDPHRVDLRRDPNPHLSFGVGPHFCLGAHLARLEATAVLEAMRPVLARLRPAGPVVRLASNFVNGIKSLPLTVVGGA